MRLRLWLIVLDVALWIGWWPLEEWALRRASDATDWGDADGGSEGPW